jgi:predicted Zn-ribbon and HTH transcriptional regulator
MHALYVHKQTFTRIVEGVRCMICDYRVSKGDFTHVISNCPHCHRDEIMDVITDERQSFDHKIGEQRDI